MRTLAISAILLAVSQAGQKPLGSFDDSASGPPKPFKSVGVRGAIDGGGYAASATAKSQSEFFDLLVDQQIASLRIPCDGLSEAKTLLVRGEAAAAIRQLDKPKQPGTQRLLGLAYESVGQFEAAAEQFHASGDSFAQSVALLLAGEPDGAQEVSRRAPSFLTLLSLGAALFEKGDVSGAIETFFQSASEQSSREAPYEFLAIALRSANPASLPRAIDRLSAPSANAAAHYALARALEVLNDGQSTRIESELKQAIALNPRLAEAHFQLAVVYAARQDFAAGIAEYRAALDYNPRLIEARYRLSQLYSRSGQSEQAKEQLDLHQKLRSAQKQEIEGGKVPINFARACY